MNNRERGAPRIRTMGQAEEAGYRLLAFGAGMLGVGILLSLTVVLIMLVPCILLVVAGISLAMEAGGGLYWLAAAFVTGTFACMTNAWVLLVEIKR